MLARVKPHKGKIKNWYKREISISQGLGYQIMGEFVDHEDFAGYEGWTSFVVAHDEATGEIETLNSRYTLVDEVMPIGNIMAGASAWEQWRKGKKS